MTIRELVNQMEEKKIQNTKIAPDAVEKFLAANVEAKTYLPFKTRYEIIETIVNQHIIVDEGKVSVDSLSQYVSFIVAMVIAHTDLDFEDPFEDYDMLCEHGILGAILAMFNDSYEECERMLKMMMDDRLSEYSLQNTIGHLAYRLEALGEMLSTIDAEQLLNKINTVAKE